MHAWTWFSSPLTWFVLVLSSSPVRGVPLGTAFTYQGLLTDNGSPASGSHDLQFTLHNAAVEDGVVAGPICIDNVVLQDGLFTVDLDFGAVFDGNQQWLAVAVRTDGAPGNCDSGTYTLLLPRQPLTVAPYAARALSAPKGHALDADDGLPADAVYVNSVGNVGIGTTTPGFPLGFPNTLGDKISLYGQSGPSYGFGIQPALLQIHTNVSGADIAFGYGSSAMFTEVMRVKGNGNVGIGTTMPNVKLQVHTPVDFYGIAHSDGTHNLVTWMGTSEGVEGAWIGPTTLHALTLQTSNLSRLTVAADGNVGIGKTTPVNRLDVSGGMVVGTAYAGSATAPANGMLVAGSVGIGTNAPGVFQLVVNGMAAKPGGGLWSVLSDFRLKRDVAPMNGTLEKLLCLHGREFSYTQEAVDRKLGLSGRQIGLMAQEVAQIFPEWVGHDDEGYLYVTERGTTALMVEALRDLRNEKDRQLAELKAKTARLEQENLSLQERLDRMEKLLAARFGDEPGTAVSGESP